MILGFILIAITSFLWRLSDANPLEVPLIVQSPVMRLIEVATLLLGAYLLFRESAWSLLWGLPALAVGGALARPLIRHWHQETMKELHEP